jgi:hypothetical protein
VVVVVDTGTTEVGRTVVVGLGVVALVVAGAV